MTNNAISDLGPSIILSNGAQEVQPILGDGTSKAGWVVYKTSAGKAAGIDADSATAGLGFAGILLQHYSTALDTAVADGAYASYVIPRSGEIYRVFIEDFGAAGPVGAPLTFGATTAGSLLKATGTTGNLNATAPIVAYLYKAVANGDTVAEVVWA